MTDFIDKLKKSIEDSYDTVRKNASNLRDIAEELSKLAKIKFELHQYKVALEKKMALLGETVYPFLMENNIDGLKSHETLQVLLDDIKNIRNQIDLLQNAVNDLSEQTRHEPVKKGKIELENQIDHLEKEIEARLKEIRAMKDQLKNSE
ncbi:MAG: DUF3939 domain-containing protein [Calditrichaceae bacterium]